MTALDFIIAMYHKFCDEHPWDDGDMIVDRIIYACEDNGIDFHRVGRTCMGGRT